MDHARQLAGAVLVLAAFVGAQMNRRTPSSVVSLAMNLVGSLGLLVSALADARGGLGDRRRRPEPARP